MIHSALLFGRLNEMPVKGEYASNNDENIWLELHKYTLSDKRLDFTVHWLLNEV